MLNRIKRLYPISLLVSVLGCDKEIDAASLLPGEYSRSKIQADYQVTERMIISDKKNEVGQLYPLQYVKTEKFLRNGQWTSATSKRKLTAEYLPASREIYIPQRGKTYQVNFKKKMLLDTVDTLFKVKTSR